MNFLSTGSCFFRSLHFYLLDGFFFIFRTNVTILDRMAFKVTLQSVHKKPLAGEGDDYKDDGFSFLKETGQGTLK